MAGSKHGVIITHAMRLPQLHGFSLVSLFVHFGGTNMYYFVFDNWENCLKFGSNVNRFDVAQYASMLLVQFPEIGKLISIRFEYVH